MERIGVVTFDCYGTLVDWDGGAGSFLHAIWTRRTPPATSIAWRSSE
jgi:FMN phosphatase YigB (HAD superfamily)